MSIPVQTFTSSRPFVIFPCPSAVNVPMRPNKLPCPAHNSVPLIENAYCPLKLAFVNFGGGGGGPPLLPPPPPQAAAHRAIRQKRSARRSNRNDLTPLLRDACQKHVFAIHHCVDTGKSHLPAGCQREMFGL